MHRARARVVAAASLIIAAALAVGGCSSGGSPAAETSAAGESASGTSAAGESASGTSAAGNSGADALSGSLQVFAAASLQVTFDQLRTKFRAAHPKVDFPPITYDGSPTLVTQIKAGAPADVFASADEQNMDAIANLVEDRTDFATNTLEIAVAPGNPKHLTSLKDLTKPGVITVICAPQVPCGTASQTVLRKSGVDLNPASEEQNVTAVLTKVETGDADAGLVYKTDVNSAGGKVEGVDFPEASEAVNTYPIAVVKDTKNAAAATAFLDLVTGPVGRSVLAGVGFGKP